MERKGKEKTKERENEDIRNVLFRELRKMDVLKDMQKRRRLVAVFLEPKTLETGRPTNFCIKEERNEGERMY